MTEHFCNNCKKTIRISGGGTYCRFHKKELCSITMPHCYTCGKTLQSKGKVEKIKSGNELSNNKAIGLSAFKFSSKAPQEPTPSSLFPICDDCIPKVERDYIKKDVWVSKVKEGRDLIYKLSPDYIEKQKVRDFLINIRNAIDKKRIHKTSKWEWIYTLLNEFEKEIGVVKDDKKM